MARFLKNSGWLAGGAALLAAAVAVATFWPQDANTQAGPPAQGRAITHAQGTTVVPTSPKRVAAFDLAALDTLDALGVDVMGVAGKDFPGYLSKYRDSKYLTLGTLFEPDYESVHAARPDLVITGNRSSARYAQLAAIAPTIDMAQHYGRPVETAITNTLMLGNIFGRETQARTLADHLQKSVAALRPQTASRGSGLIVLVTGGRMSAYGPGSRFGIIHTDFGVPPAAEGLAVSLHGEAIGSEFIQKTNPDWLFVIDRDAAIGQSGAARQVLDNPLVRTIAAWKKSQVVYLDPVTWYLVADGIQALQRQVSEIGEAYGRAE